MTNASDVTGTAATSDWLDRHAARLFWAFISVHVVLWTLLPSLLNANLPLDVIEGFAWGRQFDWGYPKHPPLTRWLGSIAAELSGHGDWAQYLLSQIAVAAAFWAVWRLAASVFSPGRSLLAVLLLEGVYYHNFTTPEFNPNVILLAFWALAVLCFWMAHTSSGGPGRLVWWLGLGVATCLGLWSKYFMALLMAPLAVLALLDPQFRRHLATPGPYLAAGIAIVGLVPHLAWMLESDFATLGYAVDRASKGDETSLRDHLLRPLRFILEQPVVLLPPLLMIAAFGWPRLSRRAGGVPTGAPDSGSTGQGSTGQGSTGQGAGRSAADPAWRRMLLVLWIGPFVLLFVLAAVTGWRLRSMWAAPLFVLAGPALMTWLPPALTRDGLRRFAIVFAFFLMLAPVAYAVIYGFGSHVTGGAKRTQFSGQALAERLDREWQSRFGREAPVILAGHWFAGNTVYYAPATSPLREAILYLSPEARVTPWADDATVREKGAIAIWRYGFEGAEQFDRLPTILTDCRERFGQCDYQEPIALPWQAAGSVPRLLVGWAVIPPVSRQSQD